MTPEQEIGLPILVARLTGLEAVWENAPRPQITNQGIALLSTFALSSLGEDVLSYERQEGLGGWGAQWATDPWPGVSPPLLEAVSGPREVTLRVRVETFDHTAGSTARTFLERLRTRLRFSSSAAELRAMNMGLQSAGSVVDLSPTYDDRVYSSGALDVRLNDSAREEDLENPLPSIDSATVSYRP